MGNYASNAQLAARFEDDAEILHLVDNVDGAVADSTTQAILTEAIDAAEGEINSYIGRQYLIPVVVSGDTELEELLRTKTLELAKIKLQIRGNNETDASQRAYDRLLAWMRDIATRKAVLAAATTPTTTAARDPIVEWGSGDASSSSSRLFTRDAQSGV